MTTPLHPKQSLCPARTHMVALIQRSFAPATLFFLCVAWASFARAQSGVWSNTTSGQLWSVSGNWNSGTVANGSGNTATFSVDITADTTVQLDSARTIGNLTFGDAVTSTAGSWILANNASTSNVLTLAGGTPTITVNALGSGKSVTISTEIAGASGLAKAGAGTLLLSASNSYSGTTSIGGGVLGISHANALGSSSAFATNGGELHLSGGITVTNAISSSGAGASLNGSLQSVSGSNTVTSYSLANNVGTRIGVSSGAVLNLPNTIGATNGQGFRFIGGGTLILGGTNTTIWSNGIGSTIGLSGVGGLTLKLGSDLAMGNSVIDFAAATTVQSADGAARNISNNLTFSVTNLVTLGAASTGNITNSGTMTISNAVNLAVSNLQTAFNGAISGTNTGSLAKSGAGTLVLGGASPNTFAGPTTVSEGVLNLSKTGGVKAIAGNLSIQSGGKVSFGLPSQIAAGAAVTMSGSNSILNGTGVNTGVFAPTETIASLSVTGGGVQTGGGSTWNVTGASSFTGGATNGTFFGHFSGGSFTTASLSLVAMTGTNGGTLGNQGFYLYGNSTSLVTVLTVGSGGLTLDSSVINLRRGLTVGAQGSVVRLEGGVATTGSSASSIVEDTNGTTNVGTVSLALSATNTGPVTRVFDVAGGGANLGVGVGITDGASSAGSLSKTGAGTLTLSGSNSFTGNTTISNGTLVLASNGWLRFVIGGNGTNNSLGGSGSATLDGRLNLVLAGASTNVGDSWTIVANTLGVTYGTNFLVNGFSGAAGVWTNTTNGVNYVFSQSSGLLSVQSTNAGGYSAWVAYWQGVYPGFTNTAATADPDGDSFDNSKEFFFDGNPTIGSPALLSAAKAGTNVVLQFVARSNALGSYAVLSTTNLSVGPWATNTNVVVTDAANQGGILIPADYVRREFTVPGTGAAFYRVVGSTN